MKAQLALFGLGSGAELSPCGRYRYRLWRQWGTDPTVLWVMLNPSKADAWIDDPTIRRCVGFSRRWGFGGLEVVNLYAWRATDPRELCLADKPVCHNPLGRGNDNHRAIGQAAHRCSEAVAAWGAFSRGLHSRAQADHALHLLEQAGVPVSCLGTTKTGEPRHPLYVPAACERRPYEAHP